MSDEIFVEGDFEYAVEDGYATLSSYCGSEKVLNIPETLGGYSVVCIGERAFDGSSSLTELSIPNSVTSIGENAFDSKTIIQTRQNSFAHEYAIANNHRFKVID